MSVALSALSFGSTILFSEVENMPFVIFDALCVIVPMTGYMDQLRTMISTKVSSNFQPGSSLILLFSNFMRVLYWVGHRFASYLLFQSIFTVVIHALLCLFYFLYKDIRAKDLSQHERDLRGVKKLWHLFDVDTALEFFSRLGACFGLIIAAALVLGVITGFEFVTEIIGLISNLTDSLTTLPPFITIVIQCDISCITSLLILQYIAGTCFKAVMFLCRPVPWPFLVGLAIQALLNLCILVQFVRIKIINQPENSEDSSDSKDEEEEEEFEDDDVSF